MKSLPVTIIFILSLVLAGTTLAGSAAETVMQFRVTPSELGGIFAMSDVKNIELCITDVPDSMEKVAVSLDSKDEYGDKTNLLPTKVELERSSGFKRVVSVPSIVGYYNVYFRAGDLSGKFSIAVIPDNPLKYKEVESPFGVNTHFNQWNRPEMGKIVKKIGIGWIRDCEARLDDNAYPVAKENGLCYMPCFTWYRSPLLKNKDKNENWDFSDVADWHKQYAQKYGDYVDYYDLVNEPQDPWITVLGGSWNGGHWQDIFVKYGKQVTRAIKEGDPKAKVLWEDIDQLVWYPRFYELGVADYIDMISPHTYSNKRIPLPEDQPTMDELGSFFTFTRQHKLGWHIWVGEMGYSTYELEADGNIPGYAMPCTELRQAQYMTRMMISEYARGVQKIFVYDFKDDGPDRYSQEHNFGLVRYADYSPKPAVLAYAVLINKLKGCKWLGGYTGAGGYAYAYLDKHSRPVIVIWQKTGRREEPMQIFSSVNEVTLTDIFGKTSTLQVKDHSIKLEYSESPIFIDGLTMKDIKPYLNVFTTRPYSK